VLRGGGTGTLVHYRIHGGVLIVAYAGGRVVSIETDSTFYRTEAGIGPGTSKGGLHGFHQDPCSLGLWDGSAAISPEGVVTIFQRSGDLVASVTNRDTQVRLDAHPTNGFTFEGWSGACSGTGACVVTLDEESVTAHFSGRFLPAPPPAARETTTGETSIGETSIDEGTI
jgi:List-Bact-rpt repeat protein